jgi:hypothetical protein
VYRIKEPKKPLRSTRAVKPEREREREQEVEWIVVN